MRVIHPPLLTTITWKKFEQQCLKIFVLAAKRCQMISTSLMDWLIGYDACQRYIQRSESESFAKRSSRCVTSSRGRKRVAAVKTFDTNVHTQRIIVILCTVLLSFKLTSKLLSRIQTRIWIRLPKLFSKVIVGV